MVNNAMTAIVMHLAATCLLPVVVLGAGGSPEVIRMTSKIRHPNFPDRMLSKRRDAEGDERTTTKAGGDLINELSETHRFSPLERISLTRSGNLQTSFSAYYLKRVDVSVSQTRLPINDIVDDKCGSTTTTADPPLAVFGRRAILSIEGREFCTATSRVRVYDEELVEPLASQRVALDQLLEQNNIQPDFRLNDAGRCKNGGMWRFYSLDAPGKIEFDILEQFTEDAYDLPCSRTGRRVKSRLCHPNFPDRMLTKCNDKDPDPSAKWGVSTNAGGSLIYYLSETHDLTPLERMAITCNGTLQLMISSMYLRAIEVSVTRMKQIEAGDDDVVGPSSSTKPPPLAVFDREVMMKIAGHEYCKATSTVRIYCQNLLDALTKQQVGIGQLLRWKDLQPKFTLHDAGRGRDRGLWRFYSMDCEGMIEFDIVEEFSEDAFNLPCMPK